MVIAAMKLKDACSLGKKSYEKPRQHIKEQRHYFANEGQSKLKFFRQCCMDVRVGLQRKLSTKELMLLNCDVGGDS